MVFPLSYRLAFVFRTMIQGHTFSWIEKNMREESGQVSLKRNGTSQGTSSREGEEIFTIQAFTAARFVDGVVLLTTRYV